MNTEKKIQDLCSSNNAFIKAYARLALQYETIQKLKALIM